MTHQHNVHEEEDSAYFIEWDVPLECVEAMEQAEGEYVKEEHDER